MSEEEKISMHTGANNSAGSTGNFDSPVLQHLTTTIINEIEKNEYPKEVSDETTCSDVNELVDTIKPSGEDSKSICFASSSKRTISEQNEPEMLDNTENKKPDEIVSEEETTDRVLSENIDSMEGEHLDNDVSKTSKTLSEAHGILIRKSVRKGPKRTARRAEQSVDGPVGETSRKQRKIPTEELIKDLTSRIDSLKNKFKKMEQRKRERRAQKKAAQIMHGVLTEARERERMENKYMNSDDVQLFERIEKSIPRRNYSEDEQKSLIKLLY